MEWLNYHHLLYFSLIVREGSVTAAADELRLAQSTVSAQLRQLEESLGEKLFRRDGRRMVLTDVGRVVQRYADEIFGLGRELLDTVKNRPSGRPLRLVVGVADQVPKLIAHALLQPALKLGVPIRLVVVESDTADLLAQLALHRVDVILTDVAVGPDATVRAYNHLLGECGVTFFAAPRLAAAARRRFPRGLTGAPILLPSEGTHLRRALDRWFEAEDVRPLVIGEFADSALLKVFGQAGHGVFVAPSAIEREVARQYSVRIVGRTDAVRERFYAVSAERRLKHPAVVAISSAARATIFD